MDCSGFERAVAALLDDAPDPGLRDRIEADARRHAASCATCARAIDLVDLAAAPAGRRAPGEEPGERYWASFDARLARRIAVSGAAEPRARRGALVLVAAAAALAAIALLRPAAPAASPPPDPSAALAFVVGDDEDAPFFPEVDGLDADARERLVEWLQRESARLDGGPA